MRPSSIKPRDDGLTLVFGSDGQASLIGLDDGVAVFTVNSSAALTSGESTIVLFTSILEATSGSSSDILSFPTSEYDTSSLHTTSSSVSSFTVKDTGTSLPSIPAVNYPSPTPTAVSSPKAHGVGAPFYLAIVFVSLSFIGCVAAFMAWWMRSRTRSCALDRGDPWILRDTISNNVNPFDGEAKKSNNGSQTHAEAQNQPYRLLARTIVRKNSSNLVAVPNSENGASLQNGLAPTAAGTGRYHSIHRHACPGAERSETALSVQENMRTLGRLRVVNRAPGDVTSGDEGGINMSQLQNRSEIPSIMNAPRSARLDQYGLSAEDPLEPHGPATVLWGRRTDNATALRRSRRRTPQMTVQTHKSPRHGRYLYPGLDGEPSGTTGLASNVTNQNDENRASSDVLPGPLSWTSTLRSSFWQAVDGMTRSRSSDSETRVPDLESGSRLTPAPQRVAPRRSPVPPTRPANGSFLGDTSVAYSGSTGLLLLDEPTTTQKTPQNLFYSVFDGFSTRTNQLNVSHTIEDSVGRLDHLPPRLSNLNHDIGASAQGRYSESLRFSTGSLYSTDTAAARANMYKYGHGEHIPSTRSAFGAIREPQLDLDHPYIPLPSPLLGSRTSSGSDTGSLSTTPSQLAPVSSVRFRGCRSSSTTTATRTRVPSSLPLPMPVSLCPGVALLPGSDTGMTQPDRDSTRTEDASNRKTASISRNDTVLSGHDVMSFGAVYSQVSTLTSTLSHKKGVATGQKRPRPPTRASPTASSVQSVESTLSAREVALRRALLERRERVKAAAAGSGSNNGEDEVDGSETAPSM